MTHIERKNQAIDKAKNILNKPIIEVLKNYLLTFNSENTKQAYKSILLSFFNENNVEVLGDLEYLPDEQIERVSNFVKPFKKERTYNHKLAVIKSFFNYLAIYGYKTFINKNTLKFKKTMEKSNTTGLSKNEIRELLHCLEENARNSRQQEKKYLMILSFLSMGLRVSEIKQLDVEKMIETDEFIYQEIDTKTGKRRFNIPFALYKKLDKYYQDYGISRVFTNNSGQEMSRTGILGIVKRTGKKVLNKDICCHSARKTFITYMINNTDENISHIMNATGHKTTQMIHYYTETDLRKSSSNTMMNELMKM
jgi:integrase